MNTMVMDDNLTTQVESSGATLYEMLRDGIYLLFLIKNNNIPESTVAFSAQMDQFLQHFEQRARSHKKNAHEIEAAKYAYSALVDETILSSDTPLRLHWERAPLQLKLFGEHLAGEGFFNKLEELRLYPHKNIEALEVFYACLCLGFQGKFLLEGRDRLLYLIDKVAKDIASVRGEKASFAPNWQLPQKFDDYVRHKLPMWVYAAVISGCLLLAFIGFKVATNSLINTPSSTVTLSQDSNA